MKTTLRQANALDGLAGELLRGKVVKKLFGTSVWRRVYLDTIALFFFSMLLFILASRHGLQSLLLGKVDLSVTVYALLFVIGWIAVLSLLFVVISFYIYLNRDSTNANRQILKLAMDRADEEVEV